MYCIKPSKKHRILFIFLSNIPWKISFVLWVFVGFFPLSSLIFFFLPYLFHVTWNRSCNNLVEHCNTVKQRLLSTFQSRYWAGQNVHFSSVSSYGTTQTNFLSNTIILIFHTFSIFSSVQSLSCVQLFAIPWTSACKASQSIINSQSLLKLMSIESVMPPNHLTLCRPLLLLPSIFPSINVFTNESILCIR